MKMEALHPYKQLKEAVDLLSAYTTVLAHHKKKSQQDAVYGYLREQWRAQLRKIQCLSLAFCQSIKVEKEEDRFAWFQYLFCATAMVVCAELTLNLDQLHDSRRGRLNNRVIV